MAVTIPIIPVPPAHPTLSDGIRALNTASGGLVA